jgi:hypothetical protein
MSASRINKRFVGETPAASRAVGWYFSLLFYTFL